MPENIISDTDKSSSINKRVREDEIVIKEVENIDFFINKVETKFSQTAVNQQKHFSEQILIMV